MLKFNIYLLSELTEEERSELNIKLMNVIYTLPDEAQSKIYGYSLQDDKAIDTVEELLNARQ